MTFDYTKGQQAKYVVTIHHSNGFTTDRCLYHSFREAKEKFNKLKENESFKGTAISLYDFVNDIRKDFAKI